MSYRLDHLEIEVLQYVKVTIKNKTICLEEEYKTKHLITRLESTELKNMEWHKKKANTTDIRDGKENILK